MANQVKVIKDVVMYWARVQKPVQNYAGDGTEYVVTALLNKETVRELMALNLNKTFKNIGADLNLSDKYPEEYHDRYLVKFNQKGTTKAGEPLRIDVLRLDGNVVRTFDGEIGNGSKGQLKLYLMDGMGASSGKMNSRLNAVLVTDLVEYNPNGTSKVASDFDLGDDVEFQIETPKPAPATPAVEDDNDFEIPSELVSSTDGFGSASSNEFEEDSIPF